MHPGRVGGVFRGSNQDRDLGSTNSQISYKLARTKGRLPGSVGISTPSSGPSGQMAHRQFDHNCIPVQTGRHSIPSTMHVSGTSSPISFSESGHHSSSASSGTTQCLGRSRVPVGSSGTHGMDSTPRHLPTGKSSVSVGSTPDRSVCKRTHQADPRYFSPCPDPDAEAIDALATNWPNETVYAFPPFNLVRKVLEKATTCPNLRLVLIAMDNPEAQWYPLLSGFKIQDRWALPVRPDLLSQPHWGHFHPYPGLLNLQAWFLCLPSFETKATPRQSFKRF